MKINGLIVHIHTKRDEYMMFTEVSNLETVANRLEIECTHFAGVISADIDLDCVDEIVITDNKSENKQKEIDKPNEKDLQ